MTRAIVNPLWGSLSLDREAEQPLQAQIFTYFRAAIIAGRLRRGLRLPSSRQLSRDYGVSRTTVVEAYERLSAEGYLVSQPGSGLFVAEHIPEDFTPGSVPLSARSEPPSPFRSNNNWVDLRSFHLPLAPGMPAVDHFPWVEWSRHMAAVLRTRPNNEIAHGDPLGERPLREAIADYLAAMKGISCDPEQIVVVGGTVQVFDIALDLMRAPNAIALVEDPVYPFIPSRLARMGFNFVGGPVDGQGMDVDRALALAPDAHFAFVSPSHNVPTGNCLSLKRRKALVDWADQTGGWILENEFDGDFRFTARPLPTCFSLSRKGRVVLIGSMSKPFAPGLRIGYLLLPPELIEQMLDLVVPQAPVTTQLALARLNASGGLATHMRMLRTVHERRRALLLEALEAKMAGLLELVHAPEAGLRMMTALPDGVDDLSLATTIRNAGIKVDALSNCYVDQNRRSGLLLGFGSTPEVDIAPAVIRLADIVRAHLECQTG